MAIAGPPSYLNHNADILVWRALEAALAQVRREATDVLLDHPLDLETLLVGSGETELDARIRDVLIPHALAAQERLLPPGLTLPPFSAQVIFSCLRGYAELDPLFLDPHVTEIIVDGPGQEVYVEREGVMEDTGLILSRERILYLIERMGGASGQSLNEAAPVMEARLPRARATAVHERLAPRGPALVVRLRARRVIAREDLIAGGSIPAPLWEALAAAFAAGANIIIAGETSSGKTTLLQALLDALPAERRIVTIEDPVEIDLPRPRLQQLEVRAARREGGAPFTQRDLVRLCLRLRPDHVIVGEVRDGAAWDMVDAMSLGHNGSIATIHAGTPIQTLERLESLCLRAEDAPPLGAVRRTIADALNLVVQMRRIPARSGGRPVMRRAVVGIQEVVGLGDQAGPGAPYNLTPLAAMEEGELRPTGNSLSPAFAARLADAGSLLAFGAPSR